MINRRLLAFFLLNAAALGRAEPPAAAVRSDLDVPPSAAARLGAERLHSLIAVAIDLDRDGVLSAAELAAAPTTLSALDLDGDGALSPDELRWFELNHPARPREATRAPGPRAGRMSNGFVLAFALDANHDGIIQAMEVANATLSLKTLDANGDGQLTPGDLRADTLVSQD